ncbi:WecB/TagA/CpsF family glycosyltransferase [Kocuria rosea]|uniref:WecB/TagA/CpsF family glycosyltransferase n=1 Tax=Kocuria rosea TaxID=1275 RepID=UPI0025B76215|nr:WecB/TagA/CpsF family glycosyltransferase [Kocuria rosea]WJZ65518.1 WecB/TagA/CpsF family glycosyltransferase [Kocuria rosea]
MATHLSENSTNRTDNSISNRVTVGGIPFIAATLQGAVEMTIEHLHGNQNTGADIHLLNVYSIALAQTDEDYLQSVVGATYNFPDGKPVAASGSLFGGRLHQVRGPSYFEAVIDQGRAHGIRHYFLGSTPETLSALEQALTAKFPGVQIAGTMSPPFRVLTKEELVAQDDTIRASNADIVWVGLGTPKQDHEAKRLAAEGFTAAAVGAAFDFSAGLKPIAPKLVRNLGFEWAHRLFTEPRRLWRRYLWGNSKFMTLVARKAFNR